MLTRYKSCQLYKSRFNLSKPFSPFWPDNLNRLFIGEHFYNS